MTKPSKRVKSFSGIVDKDKIYSLEEAVGVIEQFPKVKFDETIELHLALNIDPKSSDQLVRGTVVLPHGLGKKIRIAVFCKGELEQKAKDAGADFIGAQDLIEKVSKGFLEFDVVIATPDMMRDLNKLRQMCSHWNQCLL